MESNISQNDPSQQNNLGNRFYRTTKVLRTRGQNTEHFMFRCHWNSRVFWNKKFGIVLFQIALQVAHFCLLAVSHDLGAAKLRTIRESRKGKNDHIDKGYQDDCRSTRGAVVCNRFFF